MIEIGELQDSDIGRNVVFKTWEVGELTSWNQAYVFVRFRGPDGEACLPEDVSFEGEGFDK